MEIQFLPLFISFDQQDWLVVKFQPAKHRGARCHIGMALLGMKKCFEGKGWYRFVNLNRRRLSRGFVWRFSLSTDSRPRDPHEAEDQALWQLASQTFSIGATISGKRRQYSLTLSNVLLVVAFRGYHFSMTEFIECTPQRIGVRCDIPTKLLAIS